MPPLFLITCDSRLPSIFAAGREESTANWPTNLPELKLRSRILERKVIFDYRSRESRCSSRLYEDAISRPVLASDPSLADSGERANGGGWTGGGATGINSPLRAEHESSLSPSPT